jgi:hypothetical protein
MAMEGWCIWALFKLHYMREYPAITLGPLKNYILFGKIQEEGQFAGNFVKYYSNIMNNINLGSSETKREAFIYKNDLFKF